MRSTQRQPCVSAISRRLHEEIVGGRRRAPGTAPDLTYEMWSRFSAKHRLGAERTRVVAMGQQGRVQPDDQPR